jgi:hypothetical protein
MKKNEQSDFAESFPAPHFVCNLSPQMLSLLEKHFWCDFSDIIPALKWDQDKAVN